ncbi:uncharacterized protein LOC141606531 isoform X2 [Silene latifolia]|uniref:uncharacterized protein LOC141606531 isoform X2 n=1 Tax=Silene latifolia TaxID=37657 RepID=UPI003D76CC3C
MVGFEPELNPILNSGYTILDLLRELEEDCNDDMSTWPVEPHLVNDASMWKPFIKPCYNDDANLSSPVVGSCNTKDDDDDDASSSSRLLKPYHLRGVEDDDYEGCLTTPLIQVFSVRISTYFNDGKPCEISGSIRVLEGSCPCFHLYNRDPKDPQIIWKDGTLSLIGPKESFIVPSLSTKLELRLYDRLRDVELVAGDLSLDSDSDNRLRKAEVKGVHGIAFVDYAVFPFAVNGTVMVTVTKKNNDDGDKNCDAANIYGSIITEYENGRAYCSTDTDVKMLETRLFDKPAHQPLRVVVGTHIPLSRNVVAVPAYSSLTIKLNLWDSNGKIADDSLQYPSYLLGENPKYISTQYACVEVRVRWNDAYCYLYKDRISSSNKPESILKTGKESSGSRHVQPPILPRRFCSVVRGDNGYATVHYQMFSLAFEAWVEVKLFFDGKPPDIPINLHGTLFGRCSGEDFSTSYQKKYYMSRLFDQPRDRAVELKSGSKIALLKSIVVVPNKSSLIIEAKLDTFGIDGVAETICGMAEFKIDKCNTIVETIRGERCSIEISVKYKCD